MYKVLIVDDEMIVRHAVKSLIRWEDSRFEYVGSAANGAAALEMVQRTEPDIVITDIKMSEMDGLELIKLLMKSSFSGEVLVLSNYNDFELVREALRCGAHDYMLKLTLKTENFMAALEEIAQKLDQKHDHSKSPLLQEAGQKNTKSEVEEWLREMDSGVGTHGEQAGKEALLEVLAGHPALHAYAFCIHNLERSGLGQETARPQETLHQIAEGLFPGNHGLYVVPAEPDRFLMLIVSPIPSSDAGFPTAEELAQRIRGLSKSYYNMEICIIYGNPVAAYDGIAGQIRLNKAADYLSFYSKHQDRGIFNGAAAEQSEQDVEFKLLANQFKISLRHSGGTEIDLWLESASVLIRASADLRIPPNSLKRAIIGGVWGIASSNIVSREAMWNESLWIQRIEAAPTDSQLMLIIQDMYDEVMNMIGRNAGQKYMRQEIRQANAYLEKHFSERVFISEVAAHVGFSEPYLCQVFKAETGSSILTRLNEIRMLKAYEMLSSGNYLIKQVAMEVGIPDPFYFNRLFKKRFGVAPKTVKNIQDR
ncbi:response regulator transcription factor [Paenibacillus sp. HW567]|uniref:response regulator transcription factor n=1 Tax=Paenibacillus sp. HW567 TaxID=1034769 RepID=UPI000380F180|nr:response regulator [Paenibacillus sp. HW567]